MKSNALIYLLLVIVFLLAGTTGYLFVRVTQLEQLVNRVTQLEQIANRIDQLEQQQRQIDAEQAGTNSRIKTVQTAVKELQKTVDDTESYYHSIDTIVRHDSVELCLERDVSQCVRYIIQ